MYIAMQTHSDLWIRRIEQHSTPWCWQARRWRRPRRRSMADTFFLDN